MRKYNLLITAATAACVAGLGIGLTAAPASAAAPSRTASAVAAMIPIPVPDGDYCTISYDGFGGEEPCDANAVVWRMPNGYDQVFTIGKDDAVWTRWQTAAGLSSWVSLGGAVDPTDKTVNVYRADGWAITITIRGLDGNAWYLDRSAANGSWGTWYKP